LIDTDDRVGDLLQMMAFDAFISHSSKDKAVADATCAALEAAGIRCWIAPRDVIPGHSYGEDLIDALDACRVMVLVFSASSNASPQIAREVERCVSRGVTIVPLRIEDVIPTKAMAYFVGSVHWLDAMAPPLEQHLVKLVSAVKACLPLSPAQESTEDQPPAQSTVGVSAPPRPPAAGAVRPADTAAQSEIRVTEPTMPRPAVVSSGAIPETTATEPAPQPAPPPAVEAAHKQSEITTKRKSPALAYALIGGLLPIQGLLQLCLSIMVLTVFLSRGADAIILIEIPVLCVVVLSVIAGFFLYRRWGYITALVSTIVLTLFAILDLIGTDTFRIFPAAYPYLLGASLGIRLVVIAGLCFVVRPLSRRAA
jgi:hypothetical protein